MIRTEIVKIIESVTDEEFLSEIDHFMSIEDREYDYDKISALFDYELSLENLLADKPNPEYAKTYRKQLKLVRTILIKIGYYKPLTQEEIDNTWSSSGSKYAFRLNGVAYDTDETVDDWKFP